MAKYKILVIKHLLKNNQIAKSGDEVDGTQFVNLQASLDGNFCKKVDGKTEDKDEDTELEKEIKKIKKYKKDDLIIYAEENEVDFDDDDNKDVIFDKVVAHLEETFED